MPARRPLVILLGLTLAGCVSDAPSPRAVTWQHELGRDHPLAGQIYRVADRRPVGQSELVAALARADFVLLGEKHDNRDHHRLQTELVRALQAASAPRPRPVAFEMMTTDQQLAIVEHRQAHPGDIQGLGDALDWARSGWPSWSLYAPIAEAAWDADAEIVAANLPRAQLERVSAEGPGALNPDFVRRTGLGRELSPALADQLEAALRSAHCGHPSEAAIDGMVEAQRARDAMMADRLGAVGGLAGAILIASNEHVRTDRGVPWYLRQLRPDARIVSVGLIEVSDALTAPPADLPFDYVWFTPRVRDGDPCDTYDQELLRLSDPPASAG
jgi:uncharacterized iron-regulated protein